MAILKLNNNSLTSVTELPSGVGSDPNTKVSLARLGLRVFANQNLATSNTQNLSYDVFQDSTGIQNLTNCIRNANEFVSTGSSATGSIIAETKFLVDGKDSTNPFRDRINNVDPTVNDSGGEGGTPNRDASGYKFSGHNGVIDLNNGTLNYGTLANVDFSKAFTIEFWAQNRNQPGDRDRYWSIGTRGSGSSAPEMCYGFDYDTNNANFNNYGDQNNDTTAMAPYDRASTSWFHHLYQKHTDGSDQNYSFYLND